MGEIVKKWYVLRTIGGKERKVKEYIDAEISNLGLQDYVSQVLIPTERVYLIRNGKKIAKDKLSLPGYILVETALVGEVPHTLKGVTNVIGFLGDEKGGDPVPMRESEVKRILGRMDEVNEELVADDVPYVIGETVKVTDGPFNGFNGTVEEINEDKKKLKVMVKIFGRKTPLELGYLQVEKE